MSLHRLLYCLVSGELSTIILIFVPFYVMCLYLCAIKISPLFFSSSTVMFRGECVHTHWYFFPVCSSILRSVVWYLILLLDNSQTVYSAPFLLTLPSETSTVCVCPSRIVSLLGDPLFPACPLLFVIFIFRFRWFLLIYLYVH